MTRNKHKMKVRVPKLGTIGLVATGFLLTLYLLMTIAMLIIGRDYGIPLQNGYELSQLYAGAVVLDGQMPGTKSRIIEIQPNIDPYAVCGHVLTGHRSEPESPEEFDRNYGYFVVDMKSRKVSQGLTKEVWVKELRKHGITSVPKMRPPSRQDSK